MDEFGDDDEDLLISCIQHLHDSVSIGQGGSQTEGGQAQAQSPQRGAVKSSQMTSVINTGGDGEEQSPTSKLMTCSTDTVTIINSRRRTSFTRTSKSVTKSAFPGPAGLSAFKSAQIKVVPVSQEDSTSRGSSGLLEKPTRTEMLKYLETYQNNASILSTLNINWIRRNIDWLPNGTKIPFLLIMLEDSITLRSWSGGDRHFKTPSIRCFDQTGTIDAAFEYNFAIKYKDDLAPGTCLAVQNVPLLQLKRGRQTQAMITLSTGNLICMTSPIAEENGKGEATSSHPSASFDSVKLTKLTDFLPEVIWQNFERLLQLKHNTHKGITSVIPPSVAVIGAGTMFGGRGTHNVDDNMRADQLLQALDISVLDDWDGVGS